MSYLKSIATGFIYVCLFLAAITFIPGLPPDHVVFSEYDIVRPKDLPEALRTNERLNNPEFLFSGEVAGPECFASYDGQLYASIRGSSIVRIEKNRLVPIVTFGEKCDGLWQEHICGRPLGLKFDKKGNLYVCDSYKGLFKVDVKTGKYETLASTSNPIEGKVPKIPNSVDIASNGDVYWTDSSTEFTLGDGVYTMLTNPAGRLIRYNAATKKNEVLIKDLGFANGVHLSDDESFVIAAESTTSRIMKYHLKGNKAGTKEVFAESLPGVPDNIHTDGEGGFLVGLYLSVDSDNPFIIHSMMPHPNIRKMCLRFLTLLEAPFKLLEEAYPNYYTQRIINAIGSLESVGFLDSPKATILRLDRNGKIIDALHNTDGKLVKLSSAFIHDGYLWLGSPSNTYIARVPLKQAFPNMPAKKVKDAATPKVQVEIDSATPKPTTTAKPATAKTTTPKPTTAKPTTAKTTTPKPATTTPPPAKQASKPTVEASKPSDKPAKEPAKAAAEQKPKTPTKPAEKTEPTKQKAAEVKPSEKTKPTDGTKDAPKKSSSNTVNKEN